MKHVLLVGALGIGAYILYKKGLVTSTPSSTDDTTTVPELPIHTGDSYMSTPHPDATLSATIDTGLEGYHAPAFSHTVPTGPDARPTRVTA